MSERIIKLLLYIATNERGKIIDDISSFIEQEEHSHKGSDKITGEKIDDFIDSYCTKNGDIKREE